MKPVQCPKCRQTYSLDAVWAGKVFKCTCENVVQVPPHQTALHRRPVTCLPPVRAERSPFDFASVEPATAIESAATPKPAGPPARRMLSGRLAAGLAVFAAVAFIFETAVLVVVLRRPPAAVTELAPKPQTKSPMPTVNATPTANSNVPPVSAEVPPAAAAIADAPPIVPAPVTAPVDSPVIKQPPPAPPESFKKLAKRRVSEWVESVEEYRAIVKAGGTAREIEAKLDDVIRASANLPAFSAQEPASEHGVYAYLRMVIVNRLSSFLQIREALELHGPTGARGTDGEFTDPRSIRELAMRMPSE